MNDVGGRFRPSVAAHSSPFSSPSGDLSTILFLHMFICNLHCQLFLRISGNMLHKKHVPMQNFPLYLKRAGLASQNIVHLQKTILRCVGFCLYILHTNKAAA